MLYQDKNYYVGLPQLKISVLRGEEVLVHSEEASHKGEFQLTTAEDGHIGPYPRLGFKGAYQPGDAIRVESSQAGVWVWLRLDATMDEALVYLAGTSFTFVIPFDLQKVGHNPLNFAGEVHLITARSAQAEEVATRRCLSFNPYDSHENTEVFPHSFANVETRGEAWFASRNAMDGVHANLGHGPWPYQSWGINRDPEAALTMEFGLPVVLDEVRVTIRCDFPHDAHWNQLDLVFDDSRRETLRIEKTDLPQVFYLPEPIVCSSARVERLIKEEDPSPFPALTQIEYWGKPANL